MHRLPLTLACGLLVAIFFVAIQSPQQQQTNADDPRSSIESLLERLAKNDEAMMTLISQHGEELASVEDCHKTDSENIRTQLVALQTKVEATAEKPPEPAKVADSQCECDCKEEIAALKKRVEALEALCQAKPTVAAPTTNYVPQYGNYPTPTGNGSGGGSTGKTLAGLGSTGSRVATPVPQSYGSTGSAVKSTTSAPAFKPTVTMYTRSNCTWCSKWMATEYVKVTAQGIQVSTVDDQNGTVPRFEVCDEDGTYRSYTGFTTAETLVGNQVKRTPLKSAVKALASPITRTTHWSYPGELTQHLETEHAVSTAGLSRQEMLDLHDSLHEGSPQFAADRTSRPPLLSRPQTGWYLGKNLGR